MCGIVGYIGKRKAFRPKTQKKEGQGGKDHPTAQHQHEKLFGVALPAPRRLLHGLHYAPIAFSSALRMPSYCARRYRTSFSA